MFSYIMHDMWISCVHSSHEQYVEQEDKKFLFSQGYRDWFDLICTYTSLKIIFSVYFLVMPDKPVLGVLVQGI